MNSPHQRGRLVHRGVALGEARAAVIMMHGRGASAEDILTLAQVLDQPDVAYLAPQAAGHTWYPYSFLAPLEQNEPRLTSGLRWMGELLESVVEAGVPVERTMLLGFSQGACLALEFVARHARRYGGVAGLSGGLIGPPGTSRDYPGTLDGTPVFLGCSDVDPHIPKERVLESARVLEDMGAAVTTRLYPGMGHLVNADELDAVRTMLQAIKRNRIQGQP